MTIAVLILGVYLCMTEVTERWTNVWGEYTSLEEKRASILSPESALAKRRALQEEIVSLRSMLQNASGRVEQGESGTIESITEGARRSGVLLEALTPGGPADGNSIIFNAEARGAFHGIGKFINAIEKSPIAMRVERIDLSRETGRVLKARLTVKATILPEKEKVREKK